jgi:hypothetical protein
MDTILVAMRKIVRKQLIGEIFLASTARPRIRVTRPSKPSSPKRTKAQEQVVEDTMALVRAKFSKMARAEQSSMTARIEAIKVR